MVVCVFLSSTAPPTACVAKEDDNKTFAVIRGIISQSSSDLQANPEVKETQSQLLPMKTIRQQRYSGGIVCRQVTHTEHMHFYVCMSLHLCVSGSVCCLHLSVCAWGSQRTERRTCPESGNQHFLLPVERGSATVAVPLSLDTQATPREDGREGGKRKRRDRGWSSRLDKGLEADMAVCTSWFLFILLGGFCQKKMLRLGGGEHV